jgi:hypothetical protein
MRAQGRAFGHRHESRQHQIAVALEPLSMVPCAMIAVSVLIDITVTST